MSENSSNELVRVHIWVTGRVQGVGFRAFVLQAGNMLGLTGWVHNLGYDQVETVAEGPRQVVEQFLELVKTGPPPAHVDAARVDWEMPTGEFNRFYVK
jgi:acylphosphatase